MPFSLLYSEELIERLDAIYLTHFHADHTFGLPPTLLHIANCSRQRPLKIIGQPGLKKYIQNLFNVGYSGLLRKLPFCIEYIETTTDYTLNELNLSFALTDHSSKNYAIKVSDGSKKIAISGDGQLTDSSKDLFSDVSLLIHEAFMFDGNFAGHSSAVEVVEFAKSISSLKKLALVHICRKELIMVENNIATLSKSLDAELLLPSPGDQILV